MFDIEYRDGLAKVGKWKFAGKEILTPNILFAFSERFNVISEAEALISDREFNDPRFCLLDSGSIFLPKQFTGDNVIPPDIPYPKSLREESSERHTNEEERSRSGSIAFTSCSNLPHGDGAELFILQNAVEYLYHPREFARKMVALREKVKFHCLVYAPALSEPAHYPLLAYAGMDLFDSASLIISARHGFFLTSSGRYHREDMKEVSCHCPACQRNGNKLDFFHLLLHNYYAALSEIKLVRNAIRSRRLRELVETRAAASPWFVSVLRNLDLRHYETLEKYLPLSGKELRAMTKTSITRPEVVRFRERVKSRYSKPQSTKVLLLLPCSAKKPYSSSQSHRLFEKTIIDAGAMDVVHEVVVTSPLGIVPKELELFYPAGHYDIPVTGDWDREERAMVEECLSHYLRKNRYEHIIVHLPKKMEFVSELIEKPTITCEDAPTSQSSIEKLKKNLKEVCQNYSIDKKSSKSFETVSSIAIFQFSEAGKSILDGCRIKGRYPSLRVFKEEKQVAMLTEERGMLSLTLEGGKILLNERSYLVEIEDFIPKGNVFATGVENADPWIRIGDDVAVCHGGEIRAVGVAMMSPKEMIESERGEAVRVRHAVHR